MSDMDTHPIDVEYFVEALPTAFNAFAKIVRDNTVEKGFWRDPGTINAPDHLVQLARLALVTSEVAEAMEVVRKDPSKRDEHVPEFMNLEVELADAVIRIMDFAATYGLNVGGAIRAKHDYNTTRPYKHGKKD